MMGLHFLSPKTLYLFLVPFLFCFLIPISGTIDQNSLASIGPLKQ